MSTLFKIFRFILLVGIIVFLLKLEVKMSEKVIETSLKCPHEKVDSCYSAPNS